MFGYKASINLQSGSLYNLQASDTGKIVELSNSAGGRCYLPNTLGTGFCCTVVAVTGTWHFSASTGATIVSYQNLTKSAGGEAECSVYVRKNTDNASAFFVLGGNLA